MATNLPPNVAFDKMSHFDDVAAKIRQTYDPLIGQLIARRDALLQMVQELREDQRGHTNRRYRRAGKGTATNAGNENKSKS